MVYHRSDRFAAPRQKFLDVAELRTATFSVTYGGQNSPKGQLTYDAEFYQESVERFVSLLKPALLGLEQILDQANLILVSAILMSVIACIANLHGVLSLDLRQ